MIKGKKKTLWLLLAVFSLSLCLCFGVVTATAESVNGWENANSGKSVFTDNAGDTVIATAGNTAFGSSLALNRDMSVVGEYDLTFTLNANLSKSEEVWISIVGIYKEEKVEAGEDEITSISRTGLHFIDNGWYNVALYGNLGKVDKSFSHVVNPNESFPALTSAVDVKLSYRYVENGDTVQTLYLNGAEIMKSNLTEIYGYRYIDTDAVGFDFFNASEDVTVSNIKVTPSDSAKNYRKTNINDFIYYGSEGEFTAKRLTSTVDTANEVYAFTRSEQMNAGMFANGKSHNYEAYATVTEITPKTGAYAVGFYAWYKDVNNHVLLRADGEQFAMIVTVNGEVAVSKSAECAVAANDEFSFIKRSTSDGKTALTATLKGVTLEADGIEGIFNNYYLGVYGNNVKASYKNVKAVSFYVAYDFTEQGEWITSGASQDAWNVDGEYPVVALSGGYAGGGVTGVSVAVTEKVINDPEATYVMSFDVTSTGDTAYGVVPYYNSDADYVFAGIEKIGGSNYLVISSSKGVYETKAVSSVDGNITVYRNGESFKVTVGGESLEAMLSGVGDIAEYYGFFAAGEGTATITEVASEGFRSFEHYEENGWIKSSVQKNDIKFLDNNVYTINGNYEEAGLTADTEQRLAKLVRPEDYLSDYVIEVDLTKIAEPDGQCQRLGVVAWYLDEQNYLVLFVDQWTVWEAYQLNACGIYNGERMTDSSFNEYEWYLGFLDSPGYINQTFNLKVIKNGQTVQGFINGTMIFNKTFDEKYDLTVYDNDELYLGMFSAGIESKFENYTVRAMTAEEGTPTPPAGNRPEDTDDGTGDGEGDGSSTPPDSSDTNSGNTGEASGDQGGEEKPKKGCGSMVSTGTVMGLMLVLGGLAALRKRK